MDSFYVAGINSGQHALYLETCGVINELRMLTTCILSQNR